MKAEEDRDKVGPWAPEAIDEMIQWCCDFDRVQLGSSLEIVLQTGEQIAKYGGNPDDAAKLVVASNWHHGTEKCS